MLNLLLFLCYSWSKDFANLDIFINSYIDIPRYVYLNIYVYSYIDEFIYSYIHEFMNHEFMNS